MARALSRAGTELIVTSRRKEDCKLFVREIREAEGRFDTYSLDVRLRQSIGTLVADVLRNHGWIDILVNNAGMNIRKPFLEFTLNGVGGLRRKLCL